VLRREARWLGTRLQELREDLPTMTVAHLGSSTQDFRSIQQPYIDDEIFRPLSGTSGVRVVHCDIRDEPGVDVVIDLSRPEAAGAIEGLQANVYLLFNILEHVPTPQSLVDVLVGVARPGDHLIVSGPRRYPYHADPIDTLFRPSARDLRALFSPGFRLMQYNELWEFNALTGTSGDYTASLHALGWWLRVAGDGGWRRRDPLSLLKPVSSFCAVLVRD
jgi:hypothetical protein